MLPGKAYGRRWLTEFDTASTAVADRPPRERRARLAGAKVVVAERSVQVLRRATA